MLEFHVNDYAGFPKIEMTRYFLRLVSSRSHMNHEVNRLVLS